MKFWIFGTRYSTGTYSWATAQRRKGVIREILPPTEGSRQIHQLEDLLFDDESLFLQHRTKTNIVLANKVSHYNSKRTIKPNNKIQQSNE
jgi:hypothetical protein